MKKLIATVLVLGSGFAVSACDTTAKKHTEVPYSMDRTAGHEKDVPMKADRVFKKKMVK